MRIGVPTEIKAHEYRVGLVPAAVRELVKDGHTVLVQSGAGDGLECADRDYRESGAEIVPDAAAVYQASELIVKVKEPQLTECPHLRRGQVLLTYLHLAANRALALALQRSGCVAIAYETVTGADGALPLLMPMSQIAGRMSVQIGAHHLLKPGGGRGTLLGGVAGVPPGKVVVLGVGAAGTHAVQIARGLRAEVWAVDRSVARLRDIDDRFQGSVRTLYATTEAIERVLVDADLVIGAVLVPGAAAPKLVSEETVRRMHRGAVIVDIAIDQGGCFATSRPTSHADPTYVIDGVVHYCVTNIPGAVPRTSAFALNNATLPYVRALAEKGWERAVKEDRGLQTGLNVVDGRIVHPAVANALAAPTIAATPPQPSESGR